MSMNLHCEEVELWQTPTYITYMCYSDNDGGLQGILNRYCLWVKGTLDGVYDDVTILDEKRNAVVEHITELKSYAKLTFYIL